MVSIDIVEYMISQGADMNMVTDLGCNAFHLAAGSGPPEYHRVSG